MSKVSLPQCPWQLELPLLAGEAIQRLLRPWQVGLSLAGGGAYTATASQGLLYMAEAVYNASGLGLPVVMTVANRAIGAPINIWNDHSDSMSQRDCGWIQLFAETNQEACDLHIQAFRIAEELSIPVMVCTDACI